MSPTETESYGGLTRRNVAEATQQLEVLERELRGVRVDAVSKRVFIALYVIASTVSQLACGALIVYLTASA